MQGYFQMHVQNLHLLAFCFTSFIKLLLSVSCLFNVSFVHSCTCWSVFCHYKYNTVRWLRSLTAPHPPIFSVELWMHFCPASKAFSLFALHWQIWVTSNIGCLVCFSLFPILNALIPLAKAWSYAFCINILCSFQTCLHIKKSGCRLFHLQWLRYICHPKIITTNWMIAELKPVLLLVFIL